MINSITEKELFHEKLEDGNDRRGLRSDHYMNCKK